MSTFQFILELKQKVVAPVKKIAKSFDSAKVKIDKVQKAIVKANKPLKKMALPINVNKGLGAMDRNLKRINRILVGGFIGRTITGWGKAILDTVVDFEVFQKQLKGVFATENLAKDYLREITDFAIKAKLPIDNVTKSFVELAQRGNALDASQMQSVGDFAVFAAKDIGVLTDAITSVSDADKWKDFGVDVATSGGKMKAAFQGVTVEVANTEAGAIEMINTFAKLKAVQGASSEQTQEVGRNMTGLSNKFKGLQQEIGEKLKPTILAVINVLSNMIDRLRVLAGWVQANQKEIRFWLGLFVKVSAVILSVIFAIKLFAGVMAIIQGVTVVFVFLKNAIMAARTAMFLFNLVVLANPIGILITAIFALGAALWGLTKIFPNVYDSVVEWFGKAFDYINDNFIKPVLGRLRKIGEFLGIISKEKIDPIKSESVDKLKKAAIDLKTVGAGVSGDIDKSFGSVKNIGLQIRGNTKDKRNEISGFGKKDKATKGLSDSVSSSKQIRNTNVTIGSLVEQLIVHAASAKDRPSDVKKEMEKVFIELTNNISHGT